MNRKNIYYWLLLPVLALIMGACSKTDDVEEGSETDFFEVPGIEEDAWVSADNISDDDLTLFLDFMVKIDYMRVQYIKMLSNNFEGDKLFSGFGDKTDPDPTMRTYTAFMVNADNYLAAIERLDDAGLMTPATRTSNIGNAQKIFKASRKENERALITIQDNLAKLAKAGKYDNQAQQELYDHYKALEPDNAKAIGAKDARDFFQKLNNGDLTDYAANIRNILCYTPPLDEKKYERVGDLNSVSFTGQNEQLKSGLRVSTEVYLAATEMYLTGIDKLAGGYGAKIMEYSDLVDDRLKLLKIAKKVVQGKADWQEVNTYIVNRYADQIKGAMKDILGEDLGGLTKELMEDAVDKIAEDITEQLVAESAAEADPTTENGKKQIGKLVEDVDMAALHIYADPGKMTTRPKLIIVIDDVTGKVTMVCPNEQGDAMIVTTPGRKTITYLDGDGNRLTKKVTLEEGYNRLDVRNMVTLELKPEKVEMQAKGGVAKVDMLSNCRYYRYRFEKAKPDWIRVSRSGHTLNITVDENNSDQPRSYKFIAEVSRDKYKVAAKATVEVYQAGQQSKKEKIEASPTSLTFEAEGGQKTVKVDKKSYLYCGGFTDSDCEDWVTIANISDGSFTVTAAPNNTDKERTGTVYAFATDTTNPTADDVELLPIKVMQKAGSQQITEVEISSFKFKTGLITNCTETHYNEKGKIDKTDEYVSRGSHEGGYMDQTFTAENITSSFSGSTLHVKAEYEYRGQKYDVSFDVTGITGDYKEARVTSLTCKRVISESVFGHEKYSFTATYSNIPVDKIGKRSASDPLSLSRMTFEGTPANGMGISGHSCEKYTNDGWGGYTHYHFDLLDDAENYATLEIDFKSVK